MSLLNCVKAGMRELGNLIKKLSQLKGLVPNKPPLLSLVEIKSASWIDDCLKDLNAVSFIVDGTYWMTDQNNFLNIVYWDWVDTREYIVDRWDCDNYALAFKSRIEQYFGLNQVGLVLDWESRHAYNLVIFPDGIVMLFEPQQDSLFFISERNRKFYSLNEAVVLL